MTTRVIDIQPLIAKTQLPLPLAQTRVAAGFPSPADEHLTGALDLNQYCIKHPAATFFVRVNGDSMLNAGIHDNDLLIVDRSLVAKHGSVVIASINGELLVKRLHKKDGRLFVVPENQAYPTLEIQENSEFEIWGVVTYVLHPL